MKLPKSSLLFKALTLFLLAIIAVFGIAWLRLDSTIENNLKQNISTTLGVPTQIEKLHLNALDGKLRIDRLTIGNPEDFTALYFMQANQLEVQLNPLALLGKVVKIQQFSINNLAVNIEQRVARNNVATVFSNIRQQRNMNRQANLVGTQKKFALDIAKINRINTDITVSFTGQDGFDFELPPIENVELEDITPDNIQGVVLSDLIDRLISGSLKSIVSQSGQEVPEQLAKLLETIKVYLLDLEKEFAP